MTTTTQTAMIGELRKVLKRLHYPLEVMLMLGIRSLVCSLPVELWPSGRNDCQERGVFVDHSTEHHWALKILPVLALIFRRRKRPVGTSWRMDETYIKVAG